MKTTIEIGEALLREAKATAAREHITLRALVEAGLRRELSSRRQTEFKLRSATFSGKGLQPQVAEGSWTAIRDLAYEGRGG